MQGWTHEKRVAFEGAFRKFLNNCWINSKDTGPICLGEHLFDAQERFIVGVFDGLEQGIHNFYVLKSRQLGLSTISRALSTFWLGVHDGLTGAIVFDTDNNRAAARHEIETLIANLPASLKFPTVRKNNRAGLTISNDSTINFMSAGVKQSKGSGTLGRSLGLSFAHCSEICSWDNDEGLEAFKNALSEVNPNRLYIWESTARGFNTWHEIWMEARADITHSKCIFLGWWSKPTQRIDRSDPDFERYGLQPPTDKEVARIKEVAEKYNHQITPEQLAWVRRKMDPNAKTAGDAPAEYEGSVTRLQEQPWTEDDAFQMTGAVFFPPDKLKDMADQYTSNKFKTFCSMSGIEFTDMRWYPAPNAKSVELKVWDEPDEDGVYVVAADPAFGENERNDRSAIQVFRCYADGLDQVAEYAWPLINTRAFAWVLASLMGWYGGQRAEVYYILELNGPGEAVFNELKSLRHQVERGYQPKEIQERGLRDVFRNVRTFLFSRPDSMQPGRSYHWKTNASTKVSIMERLRDFVVNEMLHIRSLDTLEEMRSVTRDGDSIKAQGSKKDDRVVAAALAVRCWEDRVRKSLMTFRRTRESESARKRVTIQDQVTMFQNYQLQNFFSVKARQRQVAAREQRGRSYRSSTGRR